MARHRIAASVFAGVLALLPLRAAAAQEGDRVGFRAELSADTVYVGQQITYALSVRIPSEVRQRLRRNPEFVPPDPRAMLAYDLPLARTADPEAAIEVHTFRRALFVLTAGRYSIGTARLTYALPQSTSFFSREEERTLRSDAVSFVAIDPPTRGRPAGWLGAVGRWTASARAEPAVTRVGDPFVLVLRLEGEGNATLLPRPAVQIAWADIVSQDERVVLDSTPAQLGGVKEYRWLVTPRSPGLQAVPALEYPYFDPVERRYIVARSAPLAVSVRPGTLVEVPTRAAAAADSVPLALRAQLEGPALVRVPGGVLWMWGALLAPLPWLVRRTAPLFRHRATVAVPSAADTARALLETGLRARTGLDLAGFTTPGSLAAALRLEGVTPETAAEAEALRDACDEAGFAARRTPGAAAVMRTRAEGLLARVDREARRRVGAVLLLVLLAACAVRDGDPAGALAAFAAGRTAYLGQDYTQARAAFRRAAAAAPRDPATWANFGTAAWQARDTASAVYGWQRALRLDPADRDLRDRLARVRAPQHRGAARVWPVGPMPVAALALLLWTAAWAWAYRRARGGRRARGPFALLIPALALAALAARLEYDLAARHVVVVAEPTPLRALPALGADLGAMPMAGEVARVLERRGVWLRVALDGGREGWYPTERTWSLARD
jgi:tetratricopeptide (TPR) repeat protein